VTNMEGTFCDAAAFKRPLSDWNVPEDELGRHTLIVVRNVTTVRDMCPIFNSVEYTFLVKKIGQ